MVELNRLFQKDRGKTASVARIQSPNPTQQPLHCLLIQSFFYGVKQRIYEYILLRLGSTPPRRLKKCGLTQPLPACSVGSYTDKQVVQYTAE